MRLDTAAIFQGHMDAFVLDDMLILKEMIFVLNYSVIYLVLKEFLKIALQKQQNNLSTK